MMATFEMVAGASIPGCTEATYSSARSTGIKMLQCQPSNSLFHGNLSKW